MSRLKIVAVVYIVKTLLVGLAWLVVPDLPRRAMAKARQTWTAVAGASAAAGASTGVPDPARSPAP